MGFLIFILCVIPAVVTSITISPNGNSPEVKMLGGMMVDIQKGFTPVSIKDEVTTAKSNYEKSRKFESNSTRLSLNERYRRLIPYMTFYYANDLVTPTTEAYTVKNIEVEKAEIVETRQLGNANQRHPKKIYTPHRNIPRYQGNRLTQYNIASANPIKIYYKDNVPVYQTPIKQHTHHPSHSEYVLVNNNYNSGRHVQKQIIKPPSIPFSSPTRKPYYNIYQNDDTANIRYYLAEKEQAPKYKLVPYEQTPPVKVVPQGENIYELTNKPIPVPVFTPKDQVYIKPRPTRPHYYYEDGYVQQVNVRKPATERDNYSEKQHLEALAQPLVEGGFKPIINRPAVTTEIPIYTTTAAVTHVPEYESQRQQEIQYETESLAPVNDYRPNYYQYEVEQPTHNKPSPYTSDTINLANLLNTLQLNKAIPKPITRANVGSSIKTLLQVLNALKATQQNDLDVPVLSTPKPFVAKHKIVVEVAKPTIDITPSSIADDEEFHKEPYLAPANPPSQHLDDYPTTGGSSQQFPLPVTSDDEGGTPGQPGVDYPILTIIPETSFDCKTQRYKGFFADTETRCQVWHYCDLNGGQASFLCPNGTIFSQAGLTCDWWFNVKCDDTTQLYVLNESLYKYIIPHSPKFPEDYSGPLVDKYLTLKFKEMEEEFKKNKNKQSASEKMDSDEKEDSNEDEEESDKIKNKDQRNVSSVSEASVIVESPGTSGNVERLNDNL